MAQYKAMTIDVDAVYEDGVLKPERPLALKDRTKVHVTIEAKTDDAKRADADDPTGWKAIDALRGIVKGAPPDTAEKHDKCLSSEDIEQARREMWSTFPRTDL